MRKIIAFSFVLSLLCSVYAERITGFMDIKFGSSREEVETKLKEMKFTFSGNSVLASNIYSIDYTTDSFYFLTKKPLQVNFIFYKESNKMIGYSMLFFDPGEHFLKTLKDCYGDLEYKGFYGNGLTVQYYDPYNDKILDIMLIPVDEFYNVSLTYRENNF